MLDLEKQLEGRLRGLALSQPGNWLRKLPAEVRLLMYAVGGVLDLQINGSAPPLLLALCPDRELYQEAREYYHQRNATVDLQHQQHPNLGIFSTTPAALEILGRLERVRIVWKSGYAAEKRLQEVHDLLGVSKRLQTVMIDVSYTTYISESQLLHLLQSLNFRKLEMRLTHKRRGGTPGLGRDLHDPEHMILVGSGSAVERTFVREQRGYPGRAICQLGKWVEDMKCWRYEGERGRFFTCTWLGKQSVLSETLCDA